MEVSPKITLITNAEVLDSLKEWNEDQMIRGSGEFGWMRSSVMRYLEMTPAGHLSQDKIKHFLSELKQFEDRCNIKFTPNEKMQMINIIPVQPVDVHIIVEECPERMSSEMVEELVSIVTSTLLSFVWFN